MKFAKIWPFKAEKMNFSALKGAICDLIQFQFLADLHHKFADENLAKKRIFHFTELNWTFFFKKSIFLH